MSRQNLRPAPLALAIALAFGPTVGHAQNPIPAGAPVQFSITAQPLAEALNAWARQTRIQLIVQQALVAGKSAPAVSGTLTPNQALDRLLAGSGLVGVRDGEAIVIKTAAPPGDTVTLAPVTVTAEAGRDLSTEGTGTYAARGASLFKGAESLKEIPQSVSVLTRQQIEDQNLTTVESALRSMTGARVSDFDRGESVYVRGYTASKQVDGVPVQSAGSGVDMVLYDRMEMLRGPSGLLTGTGNPGGTINYVLKRPRADYALNGAVTVGSWASKRAELDVTGPLNQSGSLRGRGVIMGSDTNGFSDLGDENKQLIFGALEYDLSANTTLSANYYRSRFRYHGGSGLPTYSSTGEVVPRGSSISPDLPSINNDERASIELMHKFDNGWSARAAYSHATTRSRGYGGWPRAALDDAGLADYWLSYGRSSSKWDGADVYVSGPVQAFGREHVLTAGYSNARYHYLSGSNGVASGIRDVLHDHDFSSVLAGRDIENITSQSETITTQSGLYASARIKLAEPLTAVLGTRWTNYDSKSRTVGVGATAWKDSAARAKNEFTPYGGLVWDVDRHVTLYASYADIFIPQTQQDYQNKVLEPRVGWQAEVGAKTSWLDDRLNASVALFRLRDTNRSMVDPDHVGCGSSGTGTCYRAAGLVQSQGVELEVSGKLTPQWDVIAGYTYNQAKILKDSNQANVGKDFSLPRHLFKLWSQYRFGDDGRWSVGAGLYTQSELEGTVRQGGYTVVNARVGYRINRHWEASLSVNNLFDKTYLRVNGYDYYYNSWGEPRNVFFTVRGRF